MIQIQCLLLLREAVDDLLVKHGKLKPPRVLVRPCAVSGSVAGRIVVRQELFGARLTALVDERHDEDGAVAQVVDNAPGVGWDLEQVRVVDLGDLAARRGGSARVSALRRISRATRWAFWRESLAM